MIALVRQCIQFRELLATFITRELRARFRGSIFGSFWIVLQPLCFLLVFVVVFRHILETGVDPRLVERRPGFFPLAMFCGLVPWISMAETLSRGSGCVIEHGNLIKKFAFPSEILPVYLVGVSLVSTMVGFALVATGVLIFHGELPHHAYLLPIALFFQACFTLGITFITSSASVFIRDIGHLMPLLLNFIFFLTPIFTFGRFPGQPLLATILRWNPLTYLFETYRSIFVYHPADHEFLGSVVDEATRAKFALLPENPGAPPWGWLLTFGAVALAVLIVGHWTFTRLKPRFADEV